ncbi:MAG: S1 RNA-binding domain-containing protein [Candidatus Kerfeldbacteria bacterium]|nr:S1 RNA-binding domain-containing protein [Candidatus Kerfeldbacteria bacterium]
MSDEKMVGPAPTRPSPAASRLLDGGGAGDEERDDPSRARRGEPQTASSPMAALLAEHDIDAVIPHVGDVIQGRLLSVSKNEVHLDIDGFTTGVIRGRELFDESGDFSDLKTGDVIQATVLELENENGQMELSLRQAGHKKAWDELVRVMKAEDVVDATIIDANRGGLMVRVGRVVGFLPVSQLTTEHYPRVEGGDKNKILELLQVFVGQKFRVKIIDVNEEDDKLIVSEKAALEEQQKALIAQFNIGDVIDGTVTGVVDFGAFVEFGPKLEGLIHISELAWQRIEDPRDVVKVGDKIQAKIIQIDGTKISLSMKRLVEDPWKKAVERYTIGQVVPGKVVKINPFGAFVELDAQIHGLAHISELSHEIIRDPRDAVTAGETRDFKILSIDPKNHRLGLSLKALKEKTAASETEEQPIEPKATEPHGAETADHANAGTTTPAADAAPAQETMP